MMLFYCEGESCAVSADFSESFQSRDVSGSEKQHASGQRQRSLRRFSSPAVMEILVGDSTVREWCRSSIVAVGDPRPGKLAVVNPSF